MSYREKGESHIKFASRRAALQVQIVMIGAMTALGKGRGYVAVPIGDWLSVSFDRA